MGKTKMKTHKATAKRFKITGSGKVMRQHSGRNHNTGKKSESNRREARKWEELSKGMSKKVKKSLGL
ncbi:MAG: 50S ribosomal protein L35 [Kosmotoga sp.]|uniref:50S ribosomal protein L35 n=1 Tax=Kosmotoga sp. TaxID=1955248 RepID=UPI0025C1C047|nr:50S ribosomal protein L35 [Kosmotoga sp.]MCD6159107.1 50S ribosomal protein L35 [Kosmotoga sp.]